MKEENFLNYFEMINTKSYADFLPPSTLALKGSMRNISTQKAPASDRLSGFPSQQHNRSLNGNRTVPEVSFPYEHVQ